MGVDAHWASKGTLQTPGNEKWSITEESDSLFVKTQRLISENETKHGAAVVGPVSPDAGALWTLASVLELYQ